MEEVTQGPPVEAPELAELGDETLSDGGEVPSREMDVDGMMHDEVEGVLDEEDSNSNGQ